MSKNISVVCKIFSFIVIWSVACVDTIIIPVSRADDNDSSQRVRRKKLVKVLSAEIKDQKVLGAIFKVPRHKFVPKRLIDQAYDNNPLPIGEQQTISQPFIVAYMTESLNLDGTQKVLEVGTGSGYQAAILAECAKQVYTVEIIEALGERAKKVLDSLGYKNIRYKIGDGYDGWEQHAPFDAIIVTAAPDKVPQPLVSQLKEGGLLSIPLGKDWEQHLKTYKKQNGKLKEIKSLPVRFVPMTGKALR